MVDVAKCTGDGSDINDCIEYCVDHKFTAPCSVCKEPVTYTPAYEAVIGAYHSGCFGWPECGCSPPHRGDCPDAPSAAQPSRHG